MFSMKFFTDLAERALKTFVQAFIATLVVVPGANLFDGGLLRTAGAAGLAAALSAASSVFSSRVGDGDSAALLPTEDVEPAEG
jgi:hypothetical protein